MALVDEIKKRMFAAMKQQKIVEKEILRVAIGEIQTAASRTESDSLDDEAAQGILKKLLKSNREALDASEDPETQRILNEEIEVIESLLPRNLGPDEIVAALSEVREAIQAAPNQGPAMGVAMKTLKAKGLPVDSKDVATAVGRIRS